MLNFGKKSYLIPFTSNHTVDESHLNKNFLTENKKYFLRLCNWYSSEYEKSKYFFQDIHQDDTKNEKEYTSDISIKFFINKPNQNACRII